jgi:acyl-homoserine lactone acylase PvdQ
MECIDLGPGGVLQAMNKAIDKLKSQWGTLPSSTDISSYLIKLMQSELFKVIKNFCALNLFC